MYHSSALEAEEVTGVTGIVISLCLKCFRILQSLHIFTSNQNTVTFVYLCKTAKLLTQNAADQSSVIFIFYGISNFYTSMW